MSHATHDSEYTAGCQSHLIEIDAVFFPPLTEETGGSGEVRQVNRFRALALRSQFQN